MSDTPQPVQVLMSQWTEDDLKADPLPAPATNGKPSRPDPRAWLKEAETDIAKARRDLARDEAKIAELQARCSQHRVAIRVHEARAEGARRGIAALDAKPRGRKAAEG